ncbi:MAG TPA: APC family permease [Gaiellaceae bacterium]
MSHDAPAGGRDEQELARFGYKQELQRSLGLFSSFAVAFSYISPTTGIFALFALGLSTIGGIFFWSWPIVAAGQFLIALSFAEVASHIPIAGSVFQWAKYLSGKTHAWFTGWIYLFAGILTITAVSVTLPLALIPALNGMGWNLADSQANQRWIALILLVLVTALNAYGVRLVALINNTGVLLEILAMVVFAFIMAAFHHHQGPGVIFHSGGTSVTMSTFLVAMFMSLFVIYGFDTAATLAEETKDPRRQAPRAVLYSVAGAFVIGGIFIWATLMAVPNLQSGVKNALGPAQVIDANFSNAFATTYLLVVAAAIFVCLLSIQANVMRLAFGMARDDRLPGSKLLSRVHSTHRTPAIACVTVSLLAAIPLIQYAGAGILAIAATGMIYLSYFLGGLAILRARLRGWPKAKAPFSLGRWGIPVSLLGLAWGGGMLVNFAWPRAASNPTPNQTGKLLDFHWAWLNDRPVLWTVLVVIAAVGAGYYGLVQRRKPSFAQAPEGELFAEEAPETPATATATI